MPASEVYPKNGMLQITPASTNPKFTERKMWNMFRVCGRDDQQGGVAGAFIAKNFKGKNIAIVHDKTTYGKGLADETKKALNKAGGKKSSSRRIRRATKTSTRWFPRLKLQRSISCMSVATTRKRGLILRQMRDAGPEGADDLRRRHRHQ